MVGEIRDSETAEIAIRAALTGHQVFSTLHTNDATGAVTRLIDMGVEPFLISSSLEGVLAQRLVRRICAPCRTPAEVHPRCEPKCRNWRPRGFKACSSAGKDARNAGAQDIGGESGFLSCWRLRRNYGN